MNAFKSARARGKTQEKQSVWCVFILLLRDCSIRRTNSVPALSPMLYMNLRKYVFQWEYCSFYLKGVLCREFLFCKNACHFGFWIIQLKSLCSFDSHKFSVSLLIPPARIYIILTVFGLSYFLGTSVWTAKKKSVPFLRTLHNWQWFYCIWFLSEHT